MCTLPEVCPRAAVAQPARPVQVPGGRRDRGRESWGWQGSCWEWSALLPVLPILSLAANSLNEPELKIPNAPSRSKIPNIPSRNMGDTCGGGRRSKPKLKQSCRQSPLPNFLLERTQMQGLLQLLIRAECHPQHIQGWDSFFKEVSNSSIRMFVYHKV